MSSESLHSVPFGSRVYAKILTDANGKPLEQPYPFEIPECTGIKVDVGVEIKSLHGQSNTALFIANGKKTLKGSFDMPAFCGRILNKVCVQSDNVIEGSVKIFNDDLTIPPFLTLMQMLVERIFINVAVISSNKNVFFSAPSASKACTFTDTGDLVTSSAHGLSNGQVVYFSSVVAGLTANTDYYVVNATTNTFKVAATAGGSAIALTADGSGAFVSRGTPATKINTAAALTTGQYKYSNGVYTFANVDIGKTVYVSFMSRSKQVVDSFAIVKTTYQPTSYTANTSVKRGAATLTQDIFDLTEAVIAVDHYQQNKAGLYLLNGAQTTAAYQIRHITDGATVVSTVNIDSAADGEYRIYIDPPGNAVLTEITSVKADGVAMTETDTTPATGEYLPDLTNSYITFDSGDDGALIEVDYLPDYLIITPTSLTDTVEFQDCKGVSYRSKLPLDLVANVSPLSIEKGQYTFTGSGNFFFDKADAGRRLTIAWQGKLADGYTIEDENKIMGGGMTIELSQQCDFEGRSATIIFHSVKIGGYSLESKADDFSPIKVNFECAANEDGMIATQSYSQR